jgi:hypothetical protein
MVDGGRTTEISGQAASLDGGRLFNRQAKRPSNKKRISSITELILLTFNKLDFY